MAIKIEKKTNSDRLLKIVSVKDDAIDWAASYKDEVEASEEWKKEEYKKTHLIASLAFLEDAKPTFFVFNHPARVDISRKVRSVYSAAISNKKGNADLFTEVFNVAYIGTEEGFDGGKLEVAPRRDGLVADTYMQALEDSEVFEEIASVFIEVLNKKNPSSEVDKKKS